MSARVRLARDNGGRLEAVKVARTPSDVAVLTREAAVLRAVRHPGVVELVELRDGSDGPELVTRWVGTRSLADLAPLPIEQVVGVVASVAATLADLHARGVVHGAIEATHVLLDQRGRPVLCSFGRAVVPPTVAGPPPDIGDAADARRPSDDVRALGELLVATAGRPDDPELVPARRFGRRRTSHLHRDVLTIADHARADDPTCRPSAAAVADALAELVPAVSLPHEPSDDDSRSTPDETGPASGDPPVSDLERQLQRLRATVGVVERPRRRWPIAAGCVGVALLVVGVTAIITAPAAEPPTESVTPTTGTPTTTARVMTTSRPPTTTMMSATTTATTATASSRPGPPPVVEIDGSRYELGAPGDVAVVATWRCDNRPRPLLLRPGTGELFLFDVAARAGVDSVVRAFTTIAGAVAVEPTASSNGCPRALVTRTDGTSVAVALPPETP